MSGDKARGFLEFILAHPDEDRPRLVFADWLEEQGDTARAEFIRVQIERTRLPHWDAGQVGLRLRERALLGQHGQAWRAELPKIRGVEWGEFRRGFVATATFPSFAALQSGARKCWAATPLEAVSLPWPRRGDAIDGLAPIPELRELTLNGQLLDRGDVARLAESPLLSTLRAINVRNSTLGVEVFRRLVTSPHLDNLTALRVPFNQIGNTALSALLDAASLTSLTELDLCERGNYGRTRGWQHYREDHVIDAAGMRVLATWSGMARLRSLALSAHDPGREGLRALLRSPRVAALKELTLRSSGLDGQAMQEFGAARRELQLDVLDLGENLLRDLGPADLALAPCLRDLKVLHLDRCEIGPSGARWLVNAAFVGSLRRLNVDHNSFGPEALYRLLEKKPPWLHTLRMVDNDLGDEGAAHLAESPAASPLLAVGLAQNDLSDSAATALGKSKHLKNLLALRLHGNDISRAAMDALARSPLGKQLMMLDMTAEGQLPV